MGPALRKQNFLNESGVSRVVRQIETLPRDLALNPLRFQLNSAPGGCSQRELGSPGTALVEKSPAFFPPQTETQTEGTFPARGRTLQLPKVKVPQKAPNYILPVGPDKAALTTAHVIGRV